MRKIHSLLGIFAVFFFVDCTMDSTSSEPENPAVVSESHFVSEQEALEHLARVLEIIDVPETRVSGTPRIVQSLTSVSCVATDPGMTRSFGELRDLNDAPIAYIATFEKGEGSAILAADNRLDPVVAVFDSYVIKEEDLMVRISEPDAWRTSENLYCEEDDDYYLGASEMYKPDELGVMVMNSQLVQPYLMEYSLNEVGAMVFEEESGWELAEDKILPMLTTQWHQDAPFDLKTPGNYPPGCVTIAVAQIMAYHEYPQGYCDWELVKQYGSKGYIKGTITETDDEGNEKTEIVDRNKIDNELADLSVKIGSGCKIKYNYWGKGESFGTPRKAKKFLRNIGYFGTKRHVGYDSDEIISSLNAECPVFIGALTPECYGHAWVIDGYATYENTVKTYSGSNLLRTIVQKKLLMHCNWGWGGTYNGYFASKVFDAKNPVIGDSDEDNDSGLFKTRGKNSANYTWWFRIVTYDKPKSSES